MSASPMARQVTESKAIPTKRVLINDPSELPSHYSSTPGGTLYSTTPGGTKIVYEKSFLLNLRNSPNAKTPPNGIPESLLKGSPNASPNKRSSFSKNNIPTPAKHAVNNKNNNNSKRIDDDEQFQIDI